MIKMKWFLLAFLSLCLFFIFPPAKAENKISRTFNEGLVEIEKGKSLFVRFYPGDTKKTPIVVLNGLTQDIDHWAQMEKTLLESGAPLILFDASLQGRTLSHFLESSKAYTKIYQQPITTPLLGEKIFWGKTPIILPTADLTSQAKDLNKLLKALNIMQPVMLVGLSYGGGFALQYTSDFPESVESLVLMAPYVGPLPGQDHLIRYLISITKTMYPYLALPEDELYDYYLRSLILQTYHLSEPTIFRWGAFQPFAAFEMIRGIRHMDAIKLIKRLPKSSLHLMIAGQDQYIPREMLLKFWQDIPAAQKGSLMLVEGVEHKISESVGPFAASWINKIHRQQLELKGQEFIGHPEEGLAIDKANGRKIELKASSICEKVFLRPQNPGQPNLPIDRIDRNQEWFEAYIKPYMTPNQWSLFQKIAQEFKGL